VYTRFKRILDISAATILLLFLFPLFIIIAVLILFDSGSPVIYIQKRLGKDGRPFDFYKFRSMYQNSENVGSKQYSSKNDPRVTGMGRLLRRTSLDELPQLWNILKGDMSFIGPRPVLPYHPWKYDDYSEEEKKRFYVLPGITGLAQVKGRRSLTWKERIRYDIKYIDSLSFKNDIMIILKTIRVIMSNEGNYNTGRTDEK